jgi:hypothetical protein
MGAAAQGIVDLVAPEQLDLLPDLGVVAGLQPVPPPITELGRDVARSDDVGEQQGGQSALVLAPAHHGWRVAHRAQPGRVPVVERKGRGARKWYGADREPGTGRQPTSRRGTGFPSCTGGRRRSWGGNA